MSPDRRRAVPAEVGAARSGGAADSNPCVRSPGKKRRVRAPRSSAMQSHFQQTTTAARRIEFEVRKLHACEYHGSFEQWLVRRQAAPLFDRLPLSGRRLVPWRRYSDQDSAGGLGWAAQCDQSACLCEVDRCVSQGCRAQSVKAETDELVEAPCASSGG